MDEDCTLIGCVARLDPMKGHEILLAAVDIVVSKRSDVRVVCVGGGPLERKLKERTHELGLERMSSGWRTP